MQIILKIKENIKESQFQIVIVKSKKNFIGIKCPKSLNSSAIDEFLVIFLVAAKAKGVSTFNDLSN